MSRSSVGEFDECPNDLKKMGAYVERLKSDKEIADLRMEYAENERDALRRAEEIRQVRCNAIIQLVTRQKLSMTLCFSWGFRTLRKASRYLHKDLFQRPSFSLKNCLI